MTEANLFTALKNKFPAIREEVTTQCLIIPAEQIVNICWFLKNDLGFNYLMNLSAVDYEDKFVVVYHLYSFRTKNKVSLKVFLEKSTPAVRSIAKIWPSANWHEREAYDLMGINFIGHPDLRRILLPDDWTGYPLRKNYEKKGFIRMPQV